MTAYTVIAHHPDQASAERYIQWLVGGHAAAVLAGGARDANVLCRTDPPGTWTVEVRYMFESPVALAAYVRDHAPALRAEGVRLFGDSGVRFERTVAEVVWSS